MKLPFKRGRVSLSYQEIEREDFEKLMHNLEASLDSLGVAAESRDRLVSDFNRRLGEWAK